MRTAKPLGAERETIAMLAVAFVALATSAVTIAGVSSFCGHARTVLLETLARGTGVTGAVNEVLESDGAVDRRVVPPLTVGRSEVLQLRGYARESAANAGLAGVFAVVDGGAKIRARIDEDRFTVAVDTALPLGAHVVRMVAVPADLSAVVPFGKPIDFVVR